MALHRGLNIECFLIAVFFVYTSDDASAGTVAVSVSFPLIFLRCFACPPVSHDDTHEDTEMWGHMLYYAPFIAVFQFGWASTQIAHMALMSSLTQDKSEQMGLSGIRSVYVVFLAQEVIYTSHAYVTMSVSICPSVCPSLCDGSALAHYS